MSAELITLNETCPIPDDISIDIEWIVKRDNIVQEAKALLEAGIDSQEAYTNAEKILKDVTTHSNKLDKQRLDFCRPITAFTKKAKQVSDKARVVIEESKSELKRKMGAFVRKAEQEAQARIEEEAKAAAANPFAAMISEANSDTPQPTIQTSGSRVAEVWTWEMVDETKIPREFLTIDTVKINAAVKANKGATQIDGIRVYSETKIQAR